MKQRILRPWMILGIWFLLSAALIVSSWAHIRSGVGWDPDDQLRLVQLRDFLNGQGWFDNRQYRLNPPDGAPMHWSRLVELPLAALVVLTAPLFGQVHAEIIASTLIPLLLFGVIILLLARLAFVFGGQKAAIAAAIVAAMSMPLVIQLRPMRIDHHGWQIAMAVLALASLFHINAHKSGLVLGAALAVWLHISLEGAPMSAAFFLLLGWQWLTRQDEGERLFWTIAAFAVSSLALFLGTQARGMQAGIYCDTVSPPHIWAILMATVIMLPGLSWAPRQKVLRAFIMLSAAGASILVIMLRAPDCLTGAFGTLDPLVREYWYINVMEGMPIWRQQFGPATLLLAGPVVGVASSIYVLRTAREQHRSELVIVAFFTFYALILSLLVFRTVSVASAYAVVPTAVMINHVFDRYRQEVTPLRRLLCVAAILLCAVPGSWVNALLNFVPAKQAPHAAQTVKKATVCESALSVAALDALPKGQFLAPFDLAPMILARTPHSVLASSHHRNEDAMHDHIEIFRSSPQTAHQLIKKRTINYVIACPDEEELANYARKDPSGLWAQMSKGYAPDWLEPLPDMGKGIKVWRVR